MTSGNICQNCFTYTHFLYMFTNMLNVDNEMPSPTPSESAAVETTDIGDADDENGAMA